MRKAGAYCKLANRMRQLCCRLGGGAILGTPCTQRPPATPSPFFAHAATQRGLNLTVAGVVQRHFANVLGATNP